MNESLLKGEPRAMDRTKNIPKPFRALRESQERLSGYSRGAIAKDPTRRVERFPALQVGRPNTLPVPPPSLKTNPRREIALQRGEARKEVYLIQPIRVRSLFATLHRMSWTEEPARYTQSVDIQEAVLVDEGDKEQESHEEQPEKSDKGLLQMLSLQDDQAETSTRSTSEFFHLVPEDPKLTPDGQLSQDPGMLVDRAVNQRLSLPHALAGGSASSVSSSPLQPSLPVVNSRQPVLINGLTPEELSNRSRYENNREGTFGHYGRQEYESDQQRRQMEEMTAEKSELELQGRAPYLRSRAFFSRS